MIDATDTKKQGRAMPRFVCILAKIFRVLTVPPLLIGTLLVWFYFAVEGMFETPTELVLAVLFLSGIPTLAYAVWAVIPKFRTKGREGQRKLAFVFSLLGYAGGLLYGFLAHVSTPLRTVFLTYFLSAVLLTVCNKALRFRASGHGCGVTGPLILPAFYVSPVWIPLCLLVLALVYLSSLALKRHTLRELLAGSITALISFFVSFLLIR